MAAPKITFLVLIVLASTLPVLTVLMYKGKGGGVSDMFDGGIFSSVGSSDVTEHSLNRITPDVLTVRVIIIISYGLIQKQIF